MVPALPLLPLLAAAGCASYTEETREIRTLYRANSYEQSLSRLEESSLKEQDRNRLLYRLEKAMILDRLGRGEKARQQLIEADKIADALYTTSVSRTAATFVVNESMSDYEGEDFEKVAIHTQLALSFVGDGDLAAARVEARKINNKLHEINSRYEDHKNQYADDAFALYLSGAIYEARGEIDDAIIDYGKAVELYRGGYSRFVRGGVPDGLVRAYARLLIRRDRKDRLATLEKSFAKLVRLAEKDAADDLGEVVVVHEAGYIATKTTEEFPLIVGKQVVRFSFPVIRKSSPSFYGETGAEAGTSGFVPADNVQDMDEIARFCLEDRRLRLMAKQTARLLAKGQLTEQAYKNFGPLGGIAANVFSVVSETADTRSWTLLPEAYFITRLRLPAGRHTLKIKTGGRVQDIGTVEVKKGGVVLRRGVG